MMKVDQIVWQVNTYPEGFILHKGVVIECGHRPDDLILSVRPLTRHRPIVIERLDVGWQPLHRWFETRSGAIMAAKAICHQEATINRTELDDKLTDKLTRLTDLHQETINDDV